jgi:general secretion pathway protein G
MKFIFLSLALIISSGATARSDESRIVRATVDLTAEIKTGLSAFEVDFGRYPTTAEGLAALMTCPTNIPSSQWHGPYLYKAPLDPWGHEYVYRYPGIHNTNSYDIYSCGFDGISKSSGEDLDDINNWDPSSPHGGNDQYLNRWQMYLSSPIFHTVLSIAVLLIGTLGGVLLVVSFFSRWVRDSIGRHPIIHAILFAAFLFVAWYLLSFIPQIIR